MSKKIELFDVFMLGVVAIIGIIVVAGLVLLAIKSEKPTCNYVEEKIVEIYHNPDGFYTEEYWTYLTESKHYEISYRPKYIVGDTILVKECF